MNMQTTICKHHNLSARGKQQEIKGEESKVNEKKAMWNPETTLRTVVVELSSLVYKRNSFGREIYPRGSFYYHVINSGNAACVKIQNRPLFVSINRFIIFNLFLNDRNFIILA